MPFHLIESVLAFAFAAVWAFIGLTLIGDRLHEVRQRRIAPSAPHYQQTIRRRAGKARATSTAS